MNVKELREKYNLTQTELHEATEIPVRTLQSWESGERKVSPYVYSLLEFYLKHRQKNEKLKRETEI